MFLFISKPQDDIKCETIIYCEIEGFRDKSKRSIRKLRNNLHQSYHSLSLIDQLEETDDFNQIYFSDIMSFLMKLNKLMLQISQCLKIMNVVNRMTANLYQWFSTFFMWWYPTL